MGMMGLQECTIIAHARMADPGFANGGGACRLLVHSERYFLQLSYLFYKQETLLLGLQNLLLQGRQRGAWPPALPWIRHCVSSLSSLCTVGLSLDC